MLIMDWVMIAILVLFICHKTYITDGTSFKWESIRNTLSLISWAIVAGGLLYWLLYFLSPVFSIVFPIAVIFYLLSSFR